MQQKYKAAFTLVELLVTVAIVGILATLAMAQYEEFRKKAKDTQFNYHQYYPTNPSALWNTVMLDKSSYSNCG